MGNNLKFLREAQGWTLDEAADRVGLSRGGYIKLERGENQLTTNTIRSSARAFGVSEGDIVSADGHDRDDAAAFLDELRSRIVRRAGAVGVTAAEASAAAGIPSILDAIEVAKTVGKTRAVKPAQINALAKVLRTTPVWLFAGAGPESNDPEEGLSAVSNENVISDSVSEAVSGFVRAAYGGVIEAGAFRDVSEFEDDPDRPPSYQLADPDFPGAQVVVFDVAGDSMNALQPSPILPGSKVVCVEFEGLKGRVPLKDGTTVVVEQILRGGLHRERSVKVVKLFDDRIEFCPCSTNKKHKPIVVPREPKADDGRTVQVIAIVRRIQNDVLLP